jgi:hypothetical protein
VAAAEDERAGAVERVHQLEHVTADSAGGERQRHEEGREERERRRRQPAADREPDVHRRRLLAAAQQQDAGERARRDRQDLHCRAAEGEQSRRDDGRQHQAGRVRGERPRHLHERRRDDGDGGQLQPVQPAGALDVGTAETERERGHRRGRGKREPEPGGERAELPRPQGTDGHPELARRRPGQDVGERDELREGAVVEPAAAADVLVPEVGDMRDGPAERRQPEPEGDHEDLAGSAPVARS